MTDRIQYLTTRLCWSLLVLHGFVWHGEVALCQSEVRIKDITDVDGARSNQLFGTGLVVGLNGTGGRKLATQQMAIDMLRKMDLTTKLARQSPLDNVFSSTSGRGPTCEITSAAAMAPSFAHSSRG